MNKRGSLSIEASIGIFIIIILFAFVLTIFNSLLINEVVNQGLYKTAVETSSSKGINYTIYQSSLSEGLLKENIKINLKENIKYKFYNKLENPSVTVDYNYFENQGLIGLNYSFNLLNQPITVEKEIMFRSFLHKKLSLRELEGQQVYITNTGVKYHRTGCYYLKRSKIKIPLAEAIQSQYTPCSKCYFLQN